MRKKNPKIILEYCKKIISSHQIVLGHTIALETSGSWELGNLYFDAVAMQLEVISEYVCKLLDHTGEFGQRRSLVLNTQSKATLAASRFAKVMPSTW